MDFRTEQKKQVALVGKKAKGRGEYLRFLGGRALGYEDAIAANCYQCMGYYQDGVGDCENETCCLYLFHPYKGKKVEWTGPSSECDE